jgi:phosphate starvation-inducible PhoH-like protein
LPTKTLHFPSPRHLSSLYGNREENLPYAEKVLGVMLVTRDDWLRIDGNAAMIATAEALFTFLDKARAQGVIIRTPDFHRIADAFGRGKGAELETLLQSPLVITTNRKTIVPKTLGQKLYLQSMLAHPVVFGIGPAGTGKTYLANPWAFCPGTSARKFCLIFARSTTRCTICWSPRTSRN